MRAGNDKPIIQISQKMDPSGMCIYWTRVKNLMKTCGVVDEVKHTALNL